ncbi:MAG: nucleotidyltransferase domain-containing protein [Byssovorax sp.]
MTVTLGDDEAVVHERAARSIDLRPIQTLLTRIVEKYRPDQVWLYGSRARGDARPDSDWDLFIVAPDDTDERDLSPVVAAELRRGTGVYADLVPCRKSVFHEDRTVVNTLCNEVACDGVLIYER